MSTVLIIIHFLSFSAGIGGGTANLIIGHVAARSDPAARAALGGAARRIGLVSSAGLVLLWLTGIALVHVTRGGWDTLPALFWVKLGFVLVLTMASILLNIAIFGALRAGTPPPAGRIRALGTVSVAAAVAALVLAVAAFSG